MGDNLAETRDSDATTHDLLLCLFGLFVLDDRLFSALPTSVIIAVMERLDVSETAVRVTLTRMAHRGIFARRRKGRITLFVLTETGSSLLKQGKERVFKEHPFGTNTDGWTVLNALPPASPPSRRYQFQQRLLWAGFGAIDTRLWIAPGCVDIAARFGDMLSPNELSSLRAVHGDLLSTTDAARLVHQAWNVEAIRLLHESFLATWEAYEPQGAPLATLIRMALDWGNLLKADPGLPGALLDTQWPSLRSAATFRRLFPTLRDLGQAELMILYDKT
ncbi:PaaX family transcriptional regulator C-terminal domain-containing protein [Acetobacter sp.]|jgi:phenylacetic acid degradation operon negative regulatory protein|uniref:PaaX family transcriptional regulator C-terminal domain-containing protein n=1 Tax=Acetobacter sp. TaxID=440 RepID=UPI0025BF3581|nr:PaaX family transcriptional regulator C-terminal domain-containing protein [Acetobacter sp.]MCH4089632.1 hypothetical protein [Acetobacter sp.]MCI1300612.1 hypothetical protein [Acetobacter sp.]MCI1317006.1 hypothetical protein [Acetobacter sp.]